MADDMPPKVRAATESGTRITFFCYECGQRISISAEHAGKSGKCKACGVAVTVPRPEQPAPPVAEIIGGPPSEPSRSRSQPPALLDADTPVPPVAEILGAFQDAMPQSTGERAFACRKCGTPVEASYDFGLTPQQTCPRCGTVNPVPKSLRAPLWIRVLVIITAGVVCPLVLRIAGC